MPICLNFFWTTRAGAQWRTHATVDQIEQCQWDIASYKYWINMTKKGAESGSENGIEVGKILLVPFAAKRSTSRSITYDTPQILIGPQKIIWDLWILRGHSSRVTTFLHQWRPSTRTTRPRNSQRERGSELFSKIQDTCLLPHYCGQSANYIPSQ